MTALSVLRQIEAEDPDGGTREPTEDDYAAHERWAVETFGEQAWRDYSVGGWDERGREWI